jgi:hypothetical protein
MWPHVAALLSFVATSCLTHGVPVQHIEGVPPRKVALAYTDSAAPEPMLVRRKSPSPPLLPPLPQAQPVALTPQAVEAAALRLLNHAFELWRQSVPWPTGGCPVHDSLLAWPCVDVPTDTNGQASNKTGNWADSTSDESGDGMPGGAPKAVDWCVLTGQPVKAEQVQHGEGMLARLLPWPSSLLPLLAAGHVMVQMQGPPEERCGCSLPSLVFSTLAMPAADRGSPLTGMPPFTTETSLHSGPSVTV